MPYSSPRYLCWHTHWDRAWYVSFEQYQHRLLMVLERVLELLDNDTLPKFSLDGQTSLIQDALALSPELLDRLRPHLQSGRLHVGPWYTMPDTQMPCLEALLRNLQRGMSDAAKLGCTEFTGYLPDTFGQPTHMPMLLENVGIHTAMVWRGVRLQNEKNNVILSEGAESTEVEGSVPVLTHDHTQSVITRTDLSTTNASHSSVEMTFPLFHWQSPNGSSVLTYALPEGYFHMPFQDVELDSLDAKWEAFNALETRLSKFDAPVFLPMGGDHLGPPNDAVLDRFGDALKRDYTVVHPHEFMDALVALPSPLGGGQGGGYQPAPASTRFGQLRDWGEGCAPLLSGTLLSRPWLKYMNVKAEWMLTQLWEPLMARHAEVLADSAPSPFRKERVGVRMSMFVASQKALHHAWELLLLNQPHDDLCGCSTDSVHLQDEARYQSILDAATTWIRWHKHELNILHGEDVYLPVELPLNDAQRVTMNSDLPLPNPLLEKGEGVGENIRQETTLINDWLHDITQVPLSHRTETRYIYDTALSEPSPLGGGQGGGHHDLMQTLKAFSETLKIETFIDEGDSYNAAPRVPSRQVYTPRFQPDSDRLSATATLKVSQDLLTITLVHKGDGAIELSIAQQIFTPNLQVNLILNAPDAVADHAYLTHGGFTQSTVDVPAPTERFKGYPATNETVEWQAAGNAYHGALNWASGALVFPGHYAYEVVEDHLVLPLSRGFDKISGGRLPSRQVPAGPPFDAPGGQGIGRTLHHRLRVLDQALNESSLQYHQHQLIMQPQYPAYPLKKLRSVVDSLLVQSNELRLTAHLFDQASNSWTLRLLNTSDSAIILNLPTACSWKRQEFSGHASDYFPIQTLNISAQDWVSVLYVLL